MGLKAAATAAAVRAGISRQRESSFWNSKGEPMIVAFLEDEHLPPLAPELARNRRLSRRHQRMLRLATRALREAVSPVARVDTIPLLLVGPEPYAAEEAAIGAEFLMQLRVQTNVTFSREHSSTAFQGRAGGIAVLEHASRLLHEQGQPYVLVGGVDSHVDPELLGLLDRAGRVHACGVTDGFVPGEGAGFLLLSAQRRTPESVGIAHVAAPGLGEERGHRRSEEPHLGDGLADAVRAAVAGAPDASISSVFCSLNGESFGAKEWGVAAIRSSSAFRDGLHLRHPADCFGDLGAASGPVLLGLAAVELMRGDSPGSSLVWCASEGAPRAAVVVSR
ncbi:beta-ketoacyl synthase N-terminal-like domain-containing protein [Nannocystis bainbridge]|uniref:Beta-ketoacyl synthase N-terminal-like domain-containing protein n=1 Tax=Nannocystis bainbridge TaxID=2995303 RepID=A0ABT5DWB4_9BACT|nr:beta-ketoacyl synthase N-terminal-like domain-containing protein [Nannocystis bainbridge]MDC0717876.1 beta-ketoacyl synthase N-terminal-like domain-containing protein [Nannocystis bainbridge]